MKRLGAWDAVLLYTEAANVHTHTLKIAVIDARNTAFDFDRFYRTVERRLHLLTPLRYGLIDIPWKLHHPMWCENVAVDLDYHLRRVRVAAPGGRAEFDAAISEIAGVPLDRSRPLWEFHLLEGLADGRYAVVAKVHHALADGVASANLMAHAIDAPYGTGAERDLPPADRLPTKRELLAAAAADHGRQARRLPLLIAQTVAGVRRVRRYRAKYPHHEARARPFRSPPTFLNHVLSTKRQFASAALSLEDVKQTSKHLGVTINDLMMALSAGAVRKLSLEYDGHADKPLIVSVPISLDSSPDRICGNRFGSMMVSLPVDVGDPLERVRNVHDATSSAKARVQELGPDLLNRWAAYMPPPLAPAIMRWMSTRDIRNRLFNFPVSNVRGPKVRGYIADAPLSEVYSSGPLMMGSALNITVWSYVDQIGVGVLTDDRTFGDPHEVTGALVAEFREIRKAAGMPADLHILPSVLGP
jgi:diacylglycerol O-acyltransferase / wax synthase